MNSTDNILLENGLEFILNHMPSSEEEHGQQSDDINISIHDIFNSLQTDDSMSVSSDITAHALSQHHQLPDNLNVCPTESEQHHTRRGLDVVGSGGCVVQCLMFIITICNLQFTYQDVLTFLKNGGLCALDKAQRRKGFMMSSNDNPLTLNDFANMTSLTFSHSALYYALKNLGFSLLKVYTCDRLFNATSNDIFLLIGCLNFKFVGDDFPGFVQDDNSRHTKHSIIIHKGRIHCMNLTDARGKHINLSASKFLRIVHSNSGFSFRPSVSFQHRYLSHVNTIYKVVKCSA